MILLQTKALFIDAYRDLNHRKMFWWVLGFTTLALLVFATVGIRDNQIVILTWDIPSGMYMMFISPLAAYKAAYSFLVIQLYMGFAAAILALISTAGIFPDLIASGAIDLYLSKPLGRARLFLTKYVSGLLFVLLQISLVAFGSFLVMGLRAGYWAPGIFLVIPIVMAFFSYLYCICVLIGVVTRSAMAALFLTLLSWLLISGLNNLEVFSTTAMPMYETRAKEAEDRLKRINREIDLVQYHIDKAHAAATMAATTQGTPASGPSPDERAAAADMERWKHEQELNARWAAERAPPAILQQLQTVLYCVNTVVPKTGETLRLLDRVIISDEEAQTLKPTDPQNEREQRQARGMAQRSEMDKFFRSRSVWWIVGSSLACWVFCRRDY